MTTSAQDVPMKRGSVAVLVRQGRLLVIRRSQFVVAPGKYCFPGGAIEDGETEQEALIREIQEELGVAVESVRCVWRSVTSWHVALAWWHCRLAPEAEFSPNPAEVESVHWYSPAEMAALPELLESNHHFLQALAAGQIELDLD
jgi:8-oxo-dGTP diphosphatase